VNPPGRRPEWLKVRVPSGEKAAVVSAVMRRHGLRTGAGSPVPQHRRVLGGRDRHRDPAGRLLHPGMRLLRHQDGRSRPAGPRRARRVAQAAAELSWRHVVLTSVTRDDLPDGGAAHFAAAVRALRGSAPGAEVELLVPDFGGSEEALRTVVDAAPDILAHNVETVPRLYPAVRRGAGLRPLAFAPPPRRRVAPGAAAQIRDHGGGWARRKTRWPACSAICAPPAAACSPWGSTSPVPGPFPLVEYVSPERFDAYAALAEGIGFRDVRSAPSSGAPTTPGSAPLAPLHPPSRPGRLLRRRGGPGPPELRGSR
jgi:lipoic acid synthetase